MWDRLEQREISGHALQSGPGERPRPDLPAGADLIPQIKHIVVLMMENHSYDNYLGTLAGRGDGLPTGPDGAPDAANVLPNGQRVAAHHLTSTVQFPGNPTQTWNASHISYADGTCGGFATGVWETVPGGDPAVPMGYWTEAELPFYHGLARTFPVADRWFCSCLGPTFPNRRFLIAGTAHGLVDDLPWDLVNYPAAGTIFDALTTSGISWVNYHNVNRASVVLKRLLGVHGLIALRRLAQIGRWLPGVTNAVRGNKSFTADLYPLGFARCVRHLRTTQQFFADAAAGTLPSVSIVDPDFGAYSEENPQDIALGRVVLRRGDQRGDERAGLGVDAAAVDLRRARRLLRSRAAAGRGRAGRRPRPELAALASVGARPAAGAVAEVAQVARERRRRPGDVRAVRVPGAGGDRLPLRAARLRAQRRARPHLGAQAHRGEVEPPAAHAPRRRGRLAAGRARPDRPARVPEAAACLPERQGGPFRPS